MYVAVVPFKGLTNQRADYGLDRQLSHHVGKANNINCVFKVLFEEVTAEFCVAVIKGDTVYFNLA